MIYLLAVSIIWAFSFGIIKDTLTGLDPSFVSFVRLFISLLIFLPFLSLKHLQLNQVIKLMITGMVQFGLMYLTYILSFQFLQAYQVALFTIFTPFYVTLINDLLEGKFHVLFMGSAVLSILGTALIVHPDLQKFDLQFGFILLQISNLCFAFGQIYYRRIMPNLAGKNDASIFGLLYLGAVIIAGLFAFSRTDFNSLAISVEQIYALLYLGLIASGIAFFLWNLGARKTNAGTLAVFNNLKIPLAVIVSILFFDEAVDFVRLIVGGLLISFAVVMNEQKILTSLKIHK